MQFQHNYGCDEISLSHIMTTLDVSGGPVFGTNYKSSSSQEFRQLHIQIMAHRICFDKHELKAIQGTSSFLSSVRKVQSPVKSRGTFKTRPLFELCSTENSRHEFLNVTQILTWFLIQVVQNKSHLMLY